MLASLPYLASVVAVNSCKPSATRFCSSVNFPVMRSISPSVKKTCCVPRGTFVLPVSALLISGWMTPPPSRCPSACFRLLKRYSSMICGVVSVSLPPLATVMSCVSASHLPMALPRASRSAPFRSPWIAFPAISLKPSSPSSSPSTFLVFSAMSRAMSS